MIEDELLKWKFKQGSTEALSRIYQKYLDDLLTLAAGLSNDPAESMENNYEKPTDKIGRCGGDDHSRFALGAAFYQRNDICVCA